MIEAIKNLQHRLSDWIIKNNPSIGLDKRAEKFVQDFETDLKPSSSVLDIGAGPGVYFEPLAKRGHETTLLDVKKYKACPYPVTLFEGDRIPFEDNSFDASLLITVLHHALDPEAVLREAKRVSRESVIVIEDVYSRPGGKALCVFRDAALNCEIIGHPMNFRSHEEWKKTFRKLGFEIKREKDFHSYLLGLPIRTGLYILKP